MKLRALVRSFISSAHPEQCCKEMRYGRKIGKHEKNTSLVEESGGGCNKVLSNPQTANLIGGQDINANGSDGC